MYELWASFGVVEWLRLSAALALAVCLIARLKR